MDALRERGSHMPIGSVGNHIRQGDRALRFSAAVTRRDRRWKQGGHDVPAGGGVSTGPGCWRPKITERFPLSLETGIWLVAGVVGMTSLAGTLAGPGTAGRCSDPVVDADDPATPSPRNTMFPV